MDGDGAVDGPAEAVRIMSLAAAFTQFALKNPGIRSPQHCSHEQAS